MVPRTCSSCHSVCTVSCKDRSVLKSRQVESLYPRAAVSQSPALRFAATAAHKRRAEPLPRTSLEGKMNQKRRDPSLAPSIKTISSPPQFTPPRPILLPASVRCASVKSESTYRTIPRPASPLSCFLAPEPSRDWHWLCLPSVLRLQLYEVLDGQIFRVSLAIGTRDPMPFTTDSWASSLSISRAQSALAL